jgi:HSP20 family protein
MCAGRVPRLLTMLFTEVRDFADDVRQLFEDLERSHGSASAAGEYRPPIDVSIEPDAVRITVDLPGVPADAIRVLIKHDMVLIAGDKRPAEGSAPAEASFHLVERGFGRFARGVRLPGACDAAGARASLAAGELSITIPRTPERRGRQIAVPVER